MYIWNVTVWSGCKRAKSVRIFKKTLPWDVKRLYTNIPIVEGMAAFKEALDSPKFRPNPHLPTTFLMTLLLFGGVSVIPMAWITGSGDQAKTGPW